VTSEVEFGLSEEWRPSFTKQKSFVFVLEVNKRIISNDCHIYNCWIIRYTTT